VAGRSILEAVQERLRDKKLLLVVDNFEQVAEAAPVLEELLTAAPELKMLVTSRMVLSLRGEQAYEVPPLDLPDPQRLLDLRPLGEFEAVRLFTERARTVRPDFQVTDENAPAVAEITARLDGLPLAIELAATPTKVLTPEQMLSRLQQRLALLTSGARTMPDRQRTLRNAIAWSYDLLEAAERRLFTRLSVFTGGWTLDSAQAVCDPGEPAAVPLLRPDLRAERRRRQGCLSHTGAAVRPGQGAGGDPAGPGDGTARPRHRRSRAPAVRAQLPRHSPPSGRRVDHGGAATRWGAPDRRGNQELTDCIRRDDAGGLAGSRGIGVDADRGHLGGGDRPRCGQDGERRNPCQLSAL
jgi:hypothetical protein